MPSQSIIQALTERIQAHKQSQFTGVVNINLGNTAQWSIYFHMGRMVWANSRIHPVRRWHRQMRKHCPQLVEAVTQHKNDQTTILYAELHYSRLVERVRKGELNRINVAKAVEDYLSEILFDIVHQGTLCHLQSKRGFTLVDVEKRLSNSLFLIVRAEQAWQQTRYDWQAWQQAELVKCSPNLAPVFGQPAELRNRTSAAVYQHLVSVVDGQQTFRDISVRLNQPLLPLTRRIIPYIRQGVMGLVRVDDLEMEASARQPPALSTDDWTTNIAKGASRLQTAQKLAYPSLEAETNEDENHWRSHLSMPAKVKLHSDAPLIIYIDDSPKDSKLMGDILQSAGFRFQNIQEPTHALPLLIEHKPQMIFLDLVMPVANGYEICSQVRRVSLFKDIPIVIVTSNDSISDRVRAKMVGASGFLGKPIQRAKVLKVVHKLIGSSDHKASEIVNTAVAKAGRKADSPVKSASVRAATP
ncbi:MAG: response regulator [Phormidesmis sp.]